MPFTFSTIQHPSSRGFVNAVVERLVANGVSKDKIWSNSKATLDESKAAMKQSAAVICFVDDEFVNDEQLCELFNAAGKKGPGGREVVTIIPMEILMNLKPTHAAGSYMLAAMGNDHLDASNGAAYSEATKLASTLMKRANIAPKIRARSSEDIAGNRNLKPSAKGLATPLIQGLVKIHNKARSAELITTLYDGVSSTPIGEGATGKVVTVTQKSSGRRYACKIIRTHRMNIQQKQALRDEINIMQKLNHPNIVKIIEVFVQADRIYIVMEHCPGGELFDRIASSEGAKFSEGYTKKLVVQMLRAMNYLHSNNIMHRDLKLENFLFTSTDMSADIKLIDFGFSVMYETNEVQNRFVGTPFYMAPEVVNRKYTNAADMWSFGAVVYMMLTGELPVAGSSDGDTVKRIANLITKPKNFGKMLNRVSGVRVSANCEEFINGLMNVNPTKRFTAKQALAHRWIVTSSELPVNSTPADTSENIALTQKILQFRQFPEIKRTALQVTAHYLAHDEIKDLSKKFAELDTDANGTIEYHEFYEFLGKALKEKDPHANVLEEYLKMDSDRSFRIQFSEFLAAAIETREVLTKDAIFTAFRALDINRDGKISKEELKKKLGSSFSDGDVDAMIDECDANQDGWINLEEFRNAIVGKKLTL